MLTQATQDDAPALAAIHATAFEVPWSAADLTGFLADPAITGLIAGDPPTGFILLRAAAGEGEILTLAVDPAARGCGLGAALTSGAIDHLRSLGCESIFLEVASDNAVAIRIYERFSFTPAGVRRGYYARPDNPPADALLLTCDLNSPQT